MGISDLELVDAIRKGEIIAFQELYKRYADLMYRNILVRVNSSFDADDIFQDFFIKLWEKRANFKIESNVKVYLLVALKHHILNTIKERQIRLKYQEASGQALIEEDDLIEIDIPARILRIVGVRGEKKTADEIDAILDGRRKNWMPKPAKYTSGVLKIFSEHAVSPMKGGYME